MSIFDCPYTHTFIREVEGWAGFNDELLICPMREPRSVWLSWVKRWELKRGEVELKYFQLQYEHLEALDKEYDILYIPIERIRSHEGRIDYRPKGEYEEPDWHYIYNLPFVRKFYVRLRPRGKIDDNSTSWSEGLSANSQDRKSTRNQASG
jgi:hypothetical protein